MIINCPNCKGKLGRPMDLDYSIDVIQCGKCLKLWDLRFGEPEPYVREQHIPDTRPLPVGETPQKSIKYEDFKAELLADPEVRAEYEALGWTRRQWDAVTQLKAQILFLQNKLNEHIDKSKPKEKPRLKRFD